VIFDSSKLNQAMTAGKDETDLTTHTDQVGMDIWGHYDTQTIVSKQKRIDADICYWKIRNKFLYRYLKLQDLKLRFNAV